MPSWRAQWPVISALKDPPADADEWADKPGKLQHLQRDWEK